MSQLKNIHPGEVLLEEFLNPLNISQTHAANCMGVSPRRINEIVLGKRSITADTALRLSLFLGTSVRFWMGLQDDFDLEEVQDLNGDFISSVVKPFDRSEVRAS